MKRVSNESKVFVIFETHMTERFTHLFKGFEFSFYDFSLNNRYDYNLLKDLYLKHKNRFLVEEKYKNLLALVDEVGNSKIYFATAEGYLANTILRRLRRDRPNLTLTAVQHGLFPLSKPGLRDFLVSNVNRMFFKLFGYCPWGSGFGARIVDQYIVYTDAVKKYLVEVRGWEESCVIVDGFFLKKNLYELASKRVVVEKQGAIFFAQCFRRAGLCNEEYEYKIISSALDYVKERHGTVYLKLHPSCLCQHADFDGVRLVDDFEYGINNSGFAYGFFSTALVDAEICGLEVVSIYHPLMVRFRNFDSSIYGNFSSVVSLS